MAGGTGAPRAVTSNPAHGWMRTTRQAVLLLTLQLWHCLGLVEEPALEEALRGDDQCNATGIGGTCQVEMMQLRAATIQCPQTRDGEIWTGEANVKKGSKRCLPAWFKSMQEADKYFEGKGFRVELFKLAEFNAVYSFATKNGGFDHAANQVAKYEKFYAVNGVHPYVDAMVLPNLPGAYRLYSSRNEIYKSYNVFWKSYYKFMVRWSKVMVFFITKEWLESKNTLEELDWALAMFTGERIIVTWIGPEVRKRVGKWTDMLNWNSPFWIRRRLLCRFGSKVVQFVEQNSLDVSFNNPTKGAIEAWLRERGRPRLPRGPAKLLAYAHHPDKSKGDKNKNKKGEEEKQQCKLVDEKEKEKQKERAKNKKKKNRTKQGRRNALQKRWVANLITNLDPGVCQKGSSEQCKDFKSHKVFKVQCAGPFGRYCGESENACAEQHLKNIWSVVFVPLNFVGLSKIRKGLKISQKASKYAAIAAFKAAVKKAGKEIFKRWKSKVREFMNPKAWGQYLGEQIKDMTMDAIIMGGSLEFAETIGQKENSKEAWLKEAIEFADPTGLAEVWNTFEEQACRDTDFPEMPTEDVEYELVAEAEEGDELYDEEEE